MFGTLILCAFDITTLVQNYTRLVIIIIEYCCNLVNGGYCY